MGNRLKQIVYSAFNSMKTKVWLDHYDKFLVVLVYTVDQKDLFPLG